MFGKYRMLNVRLFQIFTLMSVLALLSMLAVACGSDPTSTAVPEATAMPAPTEAMEPTAMAEEPEPTEAAATAMPAPTDDEEVFKLKYSSPLSPPPFLISEVQKWWADEVERRSGGRIEWTDFYWSGALTKAGETLEAVEVGLADAGMVALPYYPGKLPLGNWTYAVPFGPGDPYVILEAAQRLYAEVPALREEIETYNMIFLVPSVIDTYNLISKEPIVTFEDFDGIKIASIGSYHPKIL
jgi:TRAP-type C4-dicarboxylate transport system substrate-binding protein